MKVRESGIEVPRLAHVMVSAFFLDNLLSNDIAGSKEHSCSRALGQQRSPDQSSTVLGVSYSLEFDK